MIFDLVFAASFAELHAQYARRGENPPVDDVTIDAIRDDALTVAQLAMESLMRYGHNAAPSALETHDGYSR